MAQRQIGHRKSCLVFSARFAVVNWRPRPVAKSAYCLLVERSGRTSASPSSKTIDKDRYSQGTESVSESIKATSSRAHERSASESSVPEDISASARDKSHDSGRSRESSIPEVYMKTQSHGGSIPEEIPEEYGNDTFESLDSTVTPAHSTPVRSDLSFKKDTSPSMSRKSSNDGSKSEEETSMTGKWNTA